MLAWKILRLAGPMSTSSSTMAASLPPSSRVTLFNPAAAVAITFFPVATDPVKLMCLTSLCSARAFPRSSPPETMLMTPGGRSARSAALPRARVDNGVNGEGLITTVLPDSNAEAAFEAAINTGKFHGVIAATTPRGTRCTSVRVFSSSCNTSASNGPRALTVAMRSAEALISPSADAYGLPCSFVRIVAIFSASFFTSKANLSK
mmetsp:Transcript_35061/g.56814  ORF Transcript_35061/g.56814 Transcript_35061/m.56814 type:complete len:205 (-) Transcript_35061:456-1070(-)